MNLDAKVTDRALVSILHTGASCQESLYRTRWLLAHNRLHALAHDGGSASAEDLWKEYLAELQTSEDTVNAPNFFLPTSD